MAAPDKVITNGTGPVLHDWSFKSTVSGPDEITFTAQNCPAHTTYAKGDQVPGYTALRIVDTMARLVPGSQYDIQCQARGLITGSSRITKRSNSTDPFGFDTIQESRGRIPRSWRRHLIMGHAPADLQGHHRQCGQ